MTTAQASGRDQQVKRLCWLLDTMIELLEGAQPENALVGIEQYEIEAAELIETTGLADEAEIRAEFRPVLKRTLLGWEEFGMEEFVGSAAAHEKHATYVNYQFTESGGMFHSRKFDALTADGLALPKLDPLPPGRKETKPPPGSWAEKLQQQLASCRRRPPLPDPDASFVQTLVMCLKGWLRRAQWKASVEVSAEGSTEPDPKEDGGEDKPVLTIHVTDMVATLRNKRCDFKQGALWEAFKKMGRHPGSAVGLSRPQASRLRQILKPNLPTVGTIKAIYSVYRGGYAIRTADFSVKVVEPTDPVED